MTIVIRVVYQFRMGPNIPIYLNKQACHKQKPKTLFALLLILSYVNSNCPNFKLTIVHVTNSDPIQHFANTWGQQRVSHIALFCIHICQNGSWWSSGLALKQRSHSWISSNPFCNTQLFLYVQKLKIWEMFLLIFFIIDYDL